MTGTERRGPMAGLIDDWRAARAELAALDRAEHPDITDRHGRVWTWWKGTLYVHDDALAYPADMIDGLPLPSPRLASNPNYQLCAICTSEWGQP